MNQLDSAVNLWKRICNVTITHAWVDDRETNVLHCEDLRCGDRPDRRGGHGDAVNPMAIRRICFGFVCYLILSVWRFAFESGAAWNQRRAFGAVHLHHFRDRGTHGAGSARDRVLRRRSVQCLWNNQQRPKWHQVLFNLGSMAITIATAGAVYHSGGVAAGPSGARAEAVRDGHGVLRNEHLPGGRRHRAHGTQIAAADLAGML